MMHTSSYASYGFDSGLAILWTLHVIGMLAVLVGGLMLIVWMMKTLTLAQMKTWGLRLFVAGAVVCLLTLIFLPMQRIQSGNMMYEGRAFPGQMMGTWKSGMMQNGKQMMNVQYESGSMMRGFTVESTPDAMHMSMDDMSAMLKGKTGDDFDAAFLLGMIPHHQGAIDMAEMAQQSAKHDEIKKMAAAIITAQQKEIDMMQQWQKEWGYTK